MRAKRLLSPRMKSDNQPGALGCFSLRWARLLDEDSAVVGDFLALTWPAGRACPRISPYRASARPHPLPRQEEEGGAVMTRESITNANPPNVRQAQH